MNIVITFESTIYDQEMKKLLEQKAKVSGLTVNEYIKRWIDTWAQGQAKGFYMNKIKDMSLAQLWQSLGPIEYNE